MNHPDFVPIVSTAWRVGIAVASMLVIAATTACAQGPADADALKAEIEALKQQQQETQAELDELKAILQPVLERLPKPFRPQDVSLTDSPVLGSANAKVTLVEFSDLQCPFCVRFYENTYPEIVKNYVDTGKVRYVAREFPLTSLHKEAQRASQAALCAGKQDRYWELRAEIFKNRTELSDTDLETYAEKVGVEIPPWKSCLESDIYAKKVQTDMRDGAKLGIRGTPAFVIGLSDPANPEKFRGLKLLEGAYPYEAFEEAIEAVLESADD